MTHDILKKIESRYGKARVYGNFAYFNCPSCTVKNRKKRKRYMNLTTYYSNCWICEMPLDSDALFGEWLTPSKEAITVKEEKRENPLAKQLPGTKFIPINQLTASHPAVKFLHKDHLFDLDKYYNEYKILFCPCDGGTVLRRNNPFVSSAERLIFSVVFKQEFIGWQMRSLPGTVYGDRADCLKYYHLFNKGECLYNYDSAKKFDLVVVVEGVKKALKLSNAVATFGKGLSNTQIQLVQEWKNIVILLDAEDSTQAEAAHMAKMIRQNDRNCVNVDLRKYNLPSPDEATTEQLVEIISKEWETYNKS